MKNPLHKILNSLTVKGISSYLSSHGWMQGEFSSLTLVDPK